MSDNNPDSFENVQPETDDMPQDFQQQKEERSSEEEENDPSSKKCELWTNWHFFILPGRVHASLNKRESGEETDEPDFDSYVPKTKTGRLIGVMKYIRNEKGMICTEEMLYIDVVLRRIHSFSPQMAGVDRYDEMGILQLWHGLRRFVNEFFIIVPKRRKEILEDFVESGKFSPEILHAINRLENLANIPKVKKAPVSSSSQDKPTRCWQDGLTGRDLDLFKLLSGVESMSPRNQALSVLNYILQEEPESTSSLKEDASDLSNASVSEEAPQSIRFEPEDKQRIARLLKRFPALKNRYPYLLKMIENEIPFEKFSASSDNQEHLYTDVLSSDLYFPSVLADPKKQTRIKRIFANKYVKWGVIIAVICSLNKLIGILFNAWIK